MADERFKRIVVKRVRGELRIEGQGSTRKGQHFVKKYVVETVEGPGVKELKKAQAKGLAKLFEKK